MADNQEFPVTNYTVGDDGILCETFYSPTLTQRLIIPESQVKQLLQAWVSNQKKLQAKQLEVANALRDEIEHLH